MSEETKGRVEYEIRADDSYIESDLADAEKKVEQYLEKSAKKTEQIESEISKTVKQEKESVTKHHKQENEKRVKDDEESGEKRKQSEKSVSDTIKGYIKDAADQNPIIHAVSDVTDGLSGAQAAWMGVGAAAVVVGGMAVSGADNMKQAMNQYIASTGKSSDETERYQNILEDIYANNYGEDFMDIANGMATVEKQLGELDDTKLQEVTESAFALRDIFEYDISESTRAAKALIDNFGIDGQKAMALIATGAQNGLDYSGELLDSISEYSVQFEKLGFSADEMFSIFQTGAETGAWNLDKIGDAIKEMSIRVIDGSDTTREGFELLGLDADTMAEKFAAGGESAREAFDQTIEALAELEDPLAQNTAGVDLFGTMWEDLGPEVVTQLSEISDAAYATAEGMSEITDQKYDDMASVMEEVKRNLELLLIPLGEELLPLLEMLSELLLPLIEELLSPLMEILAGLLEPIIGLIATALQPLIDITVLLMDVALTPLIFVLQLLMEVFSEVMEGIASTVNTKIGNVKKIFEELMNFIKNVFTGNWKGAWENIKNIFKTIVDSFKETFKIPINAIIDMINGFIDGINKIKIPDWVPGFGGLGFTIPKIPRLRIGMDYVPKDDFPALLHRGEAVLTAEENARLRELGGVWGLHNMFTTPDFRGQSRVIVDNMTSTEAIDYERLGMAVADALIDSDVRFMVSDRDYGRLERDLG